jgi:hypothetical protein
VCADGPRIRIIDERRNVDTLAEPEQFPCLHQPCFFNDVAPAYNEHAVYVSEMGDLAHLRDNTDPLTPLRPAEDGLL